eukprot:gene9076-10018_t
MLRRLEKEVLVRILLDWVELKDLSHLDQAFLDAQRAAWLALLRHPAFFLARNPQFKTQDHDTYGYLKWLIERHIRVGALMLSLEALEEVVAIPFLRFLEAQDLVLNKASAKTSVTAKDLSFFFSRCPSITALHVEHWSLLDNDFLLALAKVQDSQLSLLETIAFSSSNPANAASDAAIYALVCRYRSTLRRLSLRGLPIADPFLSLATRHRLLHLRHLELEGSFSSATVLSFISFCSALREVSIGRLEDKARNGFVQALLFACPDLSRLRLTGGELEMTGDLLQAVLSIRPSMEELHLNGEEYVVTARQDSQRKICSIIIDNTRDFLQALQAIDHPVQEVSTHSSPLAALKVAEVCKSNLEVLWLEGDELQDEDVHHIVAYCYHIREMHLTGDGTCSQLTDRALQHIARCLPHLKELELEDGKLVTDHGMEILLSRCKELELLNISGCVQLTEVTLQKIASNGSVKTSLTLTKTAISALAIVRVILERKLSTTLEWFLDPDLHEIVVKMVMAEGDPSYSRKIVKYLH